MNSIKYRPLFAAGSKDDIADGTGKPLAHSMLKAGRSYFPGTIIV